MRVLLVHPHYIRHEVPLGLMYISSMLKTQNHQTSLFCLNACLRRKGEDAQASIDRSFREKLDEFSPDMVGFSVMSTALDLCLRLAAIVKEHNRTVIFGGPHPTVDPEGTIRLGPVDMLCIGEGEHALLELVNSIQNNRELTNISNIWVKNTSGIHRGRLRPLVQDLDSLPIPDRTLLKTEFSDPEVRGANFITGRGCPYKCSYCINEQLQRIYHGLGVFVRFRKVEDVIMEIKEYVRQYQPELLVFSDEVFTLQKSRLLAFCKTYAEEVGLPFHCQSRVNAISEETAAALKLAGCTLISLGIESGNEFIRSSVLNRRMSDETIRKAFGLLKAAGVPTGTFNMIGMPNETEKMIRETIQLNREVQPSFVHCTIMMPMKGTRIREIYEEKDLMEKEPSGSYYADVIYNLPAISKQKLRAYQKLFSLYIYVPERFVFIVDFLFFLWSRTPEKAQNISLGRLLRSAAYRMTKLAHLLLIPEGRGAA